MNESQSDSQSSQQRMGSSVDMRILIVDGDPAGATQLSGAFARLRSRMEGPLDHGVASSIDEASSLFDSMGANVVFIDVLTAAQNVEAGRRYISRIRETRKGVVFVLYSDQKVLEDKCRTFLWWNERLSHYYRLEKSGTDEQIDAALEQELERVGLDLQISGAIQTIDNALRGDEPLLTPQQVEKVQGILKQLFNKLDTVKALMRR